MCIGFLQRAVRSDNYKECATTCVTNFRRWWKFLWWNIQLILWTSSWGNPTETAYMCQQGVHWWGTEQFPNNACTVDLVFTFPSYSSQLSSVMYIPLEDLTSWSVNLVKAFIYLLLNSLFLFVVFLIFSDHYSPCWLIVIFHILVKSMYTVWYFEENMILVTQELKPEMIESLLEMDLVLG